MHYTKAESLVKEAKQDEVDIAYNFQALYGAHGFSRLRPDIGATRHRHIGALKGKIITAVKIKLQFLHKRLSDTLATTQSTLQECLNNGSQARVDQNTINSSINQTQSFISTISENMLQTGPITISSEEYFAIGSKAFESNVALFGAMEQALDSDLKTRIPHQRSALRWSLLFCTGASIGLIWAWSSFI